MTLWALGDVRTCNRVISLGQEYGGSKNETLAFMFAERVGVCVSVTCILMSAPLNILKSMTDARFTFSVKMCQPATSLKNMKAMTEI